MNFKNKLFISFVSLLFFMITIMGFLGHLNEQLHYLRRMFRPAVVNILQFEESTFLVNISNEKSPLPPQHIVRRSRYFVDELFKEDDKNTIRLLDRNVCPYLGLRSFNNITEQRHQTVCIPHQPTLDSCEQAVEDFGPHWINHNRTCDEPMTPELCKFVHNDETKSYQIECSSELCDKHVKVGYIHKRYGVAAWIKVDSGLRDKIMKKIYQSVRDGHGFCLIKCGEFEQTLLFPPYLKFQVQSNRDTKFNINIVLVDSVARAHFYRTLPRVVESLRSIVHNHSIPATVLDFELMQSISQHTFDNLRPLFSGRLHDDNFGSDFKRNQNTLGMEVLYKHFQKLGYQTLFQEDLCWLDEWGILLSNLQRDERPSEPDEYKTRWKEFKKLVSKYGIDNWGMTHFTCHVVRQFDRTNHYDDPGKVCFGGKFLCEYFLEYVTNYHKRISQKSSVAPLFSYLHLNTAHTPYGTRVRNLDVHLSQFATQMAHDEQTLTILLSDHGHTRTRYGQTEEGRRELFSPFMFLIIPHKVAQVLGKKAVNSLILNQKRLITTVDLHHSLMSLKNLFISQDDTNPELLGLFQDVPLNRTCAVLPLAPLTRCRCAGWDNHVEDNSITHLWLAEFALGELNNKIQEEFLKGQEDVNVTLRTGFGRCQRLYGKQFLHINSHPSSDSNTITESFDLHVSPPAHLTEDEIFKVEIQYSSQTDDGIKLVSFDRQSKYSKFVQCADKSVNIKLCACQKNSNRIIKSKKQFENMISQPMFGTKPKIKDLQDGCVMLITRESDKLTIVHELANICSDKAYEVRLEGEIYNIISSVTLPHTVRIQPRTVHFVVSATRYVINDSYMDLEPVVTEVDLEETPSFFEIKAPDFSEVNQEEDTLDFSESTDIQNTIDEESEPANHHFLVQKYPYVSLYSYDNEENIT